MIQFIEISLSIVGLLLMYVFSISPSYKKGAGTYIYTKEELKIKKIEYAKKHKLYKVMSVLGLVLSVISLLINVFF